MSDEELRRLAAVRMRMLEVHPFWGYLLMQVRLVPAPTLPAFVTTDGHSRIWFNPAHTSQLDASELGFVLAHVVAHQIFLAAPRQRQRDPYLWNQAVDYAINRIVLAIQDPTGWGALYQAPEGEYRGLGEVEVLVDEGFDGMIIEAIYEVLATKPPRQAVPDCHDLELPAASSESPVPTQLRAVVDHHGGVDLHLPGDLSGEEREALVSRMAAAVEYWQQAGERGDLPGDELRQLGLLERPRIPWQRVLHRYLDQALTKDDYSRTRPNRRYLEYDIIVPGLVGLAVPSVVVALDTSGSMTPEMLRTTLGEIRGLSAEAAEVTLIVADSEIQEVIGPGELDAFLGRRTPRGGGGTDHRPVFEHIRTHGLQPAVFVGITDLESAFPDAPPPYPVLWLVPPEHASAPWGHVIVQA